MDSRKPSAGDANSPNGDQANDFFGRACPVQPGANELLVLSRNPRSSGCEMQSFAPPTGADELNVLQLYRDLRPSVSYFKMHGKSDDQAQDAAGTPKEWGGSGVTVAREADSCLVITDDHVPKGTPQQHVIPTGAEVVMANGKAYSARVVTSDPAHDLALVKVDTGADTEQVCKPAKVIDKPVAADGSVNVITMGQPYTSHAIYTSTGVIDGSQTRDAINYMIKPLPGEDPQRQILNQTVPIREGFSGGAVFNKDGKVVGINDLQTSPFTSVSTPLTKAMVDDLIARRSDKNK
ncbi:MAG: trypsin-like peptidase domain-containing protein [Cyanobacteria bacterium SZAS LIN-3]|nr:trypsin-like peptidase domain-containing protein [Cyanobacteria bacterium SZAS LIN-3]